MRPARLGRVPATDTHVPPARPLRGATAFPSPLVRPSLPGHPSQARLPSVGLLRPPASVPGHRPCSRAPATCDPPTPPLPWGDGNRSHHSGASLRARHCTHGHTPASGQWASCGQGHRTRRHRATCPVTRPRIGTYHRPEAELRTLQQEGEKPPQTPGMPPSARARGRSPSGSRTSSQPRPATTKASKDGRQPKEAPALLTTRFQLQNDARSPE